MPRLSLKLLLTAAAGLILLLAAAWLLLLRPLPPDQARAEELLNQLLTASACRFEMEALVLVGEEEREYFQVAGCRSGADSSLSGTVLGSPLELVIVGDQLYRRGQEQQWQVHRLTDSGQAAELFAELFPQQALAYEQVTSFVNQGLTTQADGSRCWQTRLEIISGGWVGEYFCDPSLVLTVDRRSQRLLSATLTAAGKDAPQVKLVLEARFWDLGAEVAVTPPVG